MAGKRGKCDWCGNDLLKMRNGVLRHLQHSNNVVCDACWVVLWGKRPLNDAKRMHEEVKKPKTNFDDGDLYDQP